MKKSILLFVTMTLAVMLNISVSFAADDSTKVVDTVAVADSAKTEQASTPAPVVEDKNNDTKEDLAVEEKQSFTQIIKEKIIEGGTGFMSIVLICLILGLAIAIERVITLNLSGGNNSKFITQVKEKISSGSVEEVRELCARTKGPIAGIFAQGLVRADEGISTVEKSLENYGSAEMNKLEKGMSWISLFISLAPMFGFMGTVIGMIDAFDTIEQAADIEIEQVAGGIKTALLTTVAGLIVAVILQVFYNYLSSTIDSIAGKMEDASNEFVDVLVASGKVSK